MAENVPWKEAEVDYIRRHWGVLPASKMAATLGRTRSSVIGAAHRAGLPNLGNPVGKPARQFKASPQERKPYTRRDETGALKVSATPKPRPKPELPLLVIPRKRHTPVVAWEGTPVTQLLIGSGQCRWIVGEIDGAMTPMCGAPCVQGRSWCAHHNEKTMDKRKTAESREAA